MTLMMTAMQLATSTAARTLAVSVLTSLVQSAVTAFLVRGPGVATINPQTAPVATGCRRCALPRRAVGTQTMDEVAGEQARHLSSARPRTVRRSRLPGTRSR
jgi:hypothetical protein